MLEHDDSNDAWRVHFRNRDRERVVVGRQVVSTIPLDRLVEMLPSTGAGPPVVDDRLTYRSLICIFLAVDGSPISADTWTYFPDSYLLVGRTHEPANWSAEMAPPGKTSLCVEVFCTVGDDVWKRRDEELISQVLTDLDRLGFLSRERVLDSWLLRVPCAYPVYRVGYRAAVDRVRGYLARWPSLHLAGRTGSFQYLNMDGVIEQALRLVEKLAGPA
jgi:protoporphyrinogen oxidase